MRGTWGFLLAAVAALAELIRVADGYRLDESSSITWLAIVIVNSLLAYGYSRKAE